LSTKTTSNPGCLAGVLSLLGLKPQKPSILFEKTIGSVPVDVFPYRVRDDFLSPAEHSFFLVVKKMMGEYFSVCPKVSLADIFFVTRPNENMSAYNRINRKHVDFLICEPKTMQPRFAIELDDRSHQRPDRQERDDFVDGVFEAASLPLVHVPAQAAYNTAELASLFNQALNPGGRLLAQPVKPEGEASPIGAPSSADLQQAPFCPKCSVRMVLRTARNGDRIGQKFYGCPNYPRCREVAVYQG
jgi:Protein of unknown function (DUF2726)/Topoisomerase DNA binding C4 zinc finger